MPNHPAPWEGRPSRQVARAARTQEGTELAIYEHQLGARYLAECDRIDSEAIADVTKGAIEEELSVLDYGLDQAGGSAAKIELVSRLVGIQSRIDAARIARRFGA